MAEAHEIGPRAASGVWRGRRARRGLFPLGWALGSTLGSAGVVGRHGGRSGATQVRSGGGEDDGQVGGPGPPSCRWSPVDKFVYTGYAPDLGETTTIRISRDTHARVTRLAAERHETIDETVSKAIRALGQDAMARDLAADHTDEETEWLDADAG